MTSTAPQLPFQRPNALELAPIYDELRVEIGRAHV